MKNLNYIFLLVVILFATGCRRSSHYDIEYIPFLEDADGKYGLISPDGEVLFSEKFKHCPTIATEGRFWAMNKEGFYELYTTDSEPEKLDGEFRYVSPFFHGRAIATPRDKHIAIIDKKGETLVSLKKIDKYTPDYITSMAEGHAVFGVDTLQGVINYKGEMIVKPSYYVIAPMNDGMMVAVDRAYALGPDITGKMPKGYATVINDHGEKVLKISSRKYAACSPFVYDGYLPVAAVKDSTLAWGIIDMKGVEIVKPSASMTQITEMQGENFIYRDKDDKYGVRNIKGENILEAKYEILSFVGKDIVMADANPYFKETPDDSEKARLISIGKDKGSLGKYQQATIFFPDSYKYAFVQSKSGKWSILDRNGVHLDNLPSIRHIEINFGDDLIQSDYINIDIFLSNVGFSQAGVDSLSFSSSVKKVLDRQSRYFSNAAKQKPADLLNTTEVNIYRTVDGVNVSEIIAFPTTLSHRTYRTETVYDYDYYYNSWGNYWDTYWYSYNREVPAGYEFSSSNPSSFEMSFDNYGVLRGKLKQVYQKLAKEFKQMGSVIDENKSAVLVRLSNGREAVVYIDGHNVVAKWGTLSASDRDISSHSGAKEIIEINADEP